MFSPSPDAPLYWLLLPVLLPWKGSVAAAALCLSVLYAPARLVEDEHHQDDHGRDGNFSTPHQEEVQEHHVRYHNCQKEHHDRGKGELLRVKYPASGNLHHAA